MWAEQFISQEMAVRVGCWWGGSILDVGGGDVICFPFRLGLFLFVVILSNINVLL